MVEPLVDLMVRLDVSANQVTAASLVTAALAAALLYLAVPAAYLAAAVVVVVNGVLDVIDGELARVTQTESSRGDFLDHAADRYSDTLILVGAAAGVDAWIPGFFAVSGVLLTAYMGTQAQAVGVGRMYSGLLARADILALVTLASVVSAFGVGVAALHPVELVLILFAVLGHLTALQRLVLTWRELP